MEIFGLLYRRVGEGERKGLMIGLCCWVESLIDIKNSGRFERASLYSFCWWGKVCKQKLCLVWLGDAPRIWHEKVPWWQEHVKLLKSTIIYQAFVLWCWTFLFGFAALLFKSLAPRCGLWDFFQIMPLSGNGKAPWGCFELDAIWFLFYNLLHSNDESGKG